MTNLVLAALPPGQRRVISAFRWGHADVTYPAVAHALGVHVGTVYRTIKAVKEHHPEAYALWQGFRSRSLAVRHERALKKKRRHTDRWFARKRMRERRRQRREAETMNIAADLSWV
jgi:hypothetical protein